MQDEPSFFAEPRNWVVLAFILFFVLFGKKLWGALAAMLDARAASVRAEMDEAARLRSEAEAMLKEAEAARAKAQTDAKLLIEGAAAEAARVAEATRAEAEASAKRREQMALDRIAAALRVPNVMPATVVLNSDGSVAQTLPRAFTTADEISVAVGAQPRCHRAEPGSWTDEGGAGEHRRRS